MHRIVRTDRKLMLMKNVVLVHGGLVDGAGWEGVYRILKNDGYQVSVVQNPTMTLEDDVAVTRRVLATEDAPSGACRPLLRRSGDR